MIAKVNSWSEWNENGEIEVKVDLSVLESLANEYRSKLEELLHKERYDEFFLLLEEFKPIIEKIDGRREYIRKTQSEMVF